MSTLKPITVDEATITLTVQQEDALIVDNAMDSGYPDIDRDCVQDIIERLNQGDVWAWAFVTVTVTWHTFSGINYLGCCTYKDEDDFKTSDSDYYEDMVSEALDNMNNSMFATYESLKERITP
jgi:hypothetical protein